MSQNCSNFLFLYSCSSSLLLRLFLFSLGFHFIYLSYSSTLGHQWLYCLLAALPTLEYPLHTFDYFSLSSRILSSFPNPSSSYFRSFLFLSQAFLLFSDLDLSSLLYIRLFLFLSWTFPFLSFLFLSQTFPLFFLRPIIFLSYAPSYCYLRALLFLSQTLHLLITKP